jgi:alanyl-tRNA synthetase
MSATVPSAAQIRQQFLDFFKEKRHSIVPSDNVGYTSRDGARIFTNAGMNQFVPIFLGERQPDVDTWPGVLHKGLPTRAADTQKCIRAGGKHNDLEDVGLDTYHHTFFEMLGNWSFGDYFKKEAIDWAWEFIVERFKFPPNRVYATIYQPGEGDPADRDQESWELWAEKFRAVGLDPETHIVTGGKKDNFWMMADTGPCGPCTELHIDLTPAGDTRGALVNQGTAECIEIWNLVFIQYNANPDGTFSELPARHVDTGMGFERLCSIIQGTKNFTDFANARISNYNTDVFSPIFDQLEKLSGKRYQGTLPQPNADGLVVPVSEQEKIDVAFRVIADHLRTLSFAIADGIQPGNTDRNYTLRRILRRAVKYGRTLGFTEPFFFRLVDVLVAQMGGVFPELTVKQEQIKSVLKLEEEAFNRTLDRGMAKFEEEVARIQEHGRPRPSQEAPPPPARQETGEATLPSGIAEPTYQKRRLPRFERPWGKYMVTFTTRERVTLSPVERDEVLASIQHAVTEGQILLYAARVMPDHAHMLFEPQIKGHNEGGEPVFWSLRDIMQPLKSATAHRILKARKAAGETLSHIWEEEFFDTLVRSESDLEEKYLYILTNPREAGLVDAGERYPWLAGQFLEVNEGGLVAGNSAAAPVELGARGGGAPCNGRGRPCSSNISAAFAFQLYDTYGFPLDLTELLARERGLTVDTEGFEKLMEEQRARARAAMKKNVVSLSEIETKDATQFLGYEALETEAKVLEVVAMQDKTAVVLDSSVCYAEMGGQVGDSGEIILGANTFPVMATTKVGNTWLHFLGGEDAPPVEATVQLVVDATRRHAIERHHTVTHILHWALHEVVSKDATQKGSNVAADKLTFDFNSAALTPAQLADIERLVIERVIANDPVSWCEVPYQEVRTNPEIMQLFGEKYPDTVRVVQIGGKAQALDGWSMELCGGTHTRRTGEIGLFRLVAEGAVAAGVRRIEAIAGLEAYNAARAEADLLKLLSGKLLAQSPADLEKKIESLLDQQKALEKALKAAQQREAAGRAKELLASAEGNSIIAHLGEVDADYAMALNDALKSQFPGVIVLAATGGGSVALFASVAKEHQGRVKAGDIIKTIAPIVGGKGGGKPDFARGGGKDVSQVEAALAEARKLAAG